MKFEISAIRLRKALSEASLTQQELVNATGINKGSISQYVNGSHCPSNRTAYSMGKVLGVSPAWLMGLDVPKYQINETTPAELSPSVIDLAQRISRLPKEKQNLIIELIKQMEG